MESRQLRALQTGKTDRKVPSSALAISLLALIVAAIACLIWRESLRQYSATVWLLALIPCILLAYYKGWQGVASAAAMTMAAILVTQATLALWLHTAVDIRLLAITVAIFVVVGIAIAILAHLQDRNRGGALHTLADPMTGLPNRQILELFFMRYFAAAQRGQKLSVVVFEFDHRGNRKARRRRAAVGAFARILDRNTRAPDVSGRYDGGRFLALLPRATAGGAFTFALRIRKETEADPLLGGNGITVSAGVAAYGRGMTRQADLLAAAEGALQAANEAGENRVMVCIDEAEARKEQPVAGPTTVQARAPDAQEGISPPSYTSLLARSRRRRR